MAAKLKILTTWDDEAQVWVAESDDVPGLVAEAESIPALLAKLKVMVPEMLEENGLLDERYGEIPFELVASVSAAAPNLTHH
jgi:predicted RNase H-like HicB family nuclease